MSTQQFSQKEKFRIASQYESGQFTQEDLAQSWGTSRTSIQRILKEMGRQYKSSKRVSVSQDEAEVLEFVRANKITPRRLKDLLSTPVLTKKNVQLFLTNLSPEDYDTFTSAVGYARIQRKAAAQVQQQQAANSPDEPDKEVVYG